MALVFGSAAAFAEPTTSSPMPSAFGPGPRAVVVVPPQTSAHAQISKTLYLERCKGGCTINGAGSTDARTMTSMIPDPGPHAVTEYQNGAHQTGAAADAEWNMLVQCMKEVYSPYDVLVTDVKPPAGVSYHLALIAGTSQEILGQGGNGILGIAPLSSDCSPQDNVISFSFANSHPNTETLDRVNNICWTAAQESAHAFGLDHEYEYVDQRSACNDPMTYRVDCGGEKFFRNESAKCGENSPRQCRCGALQNSHLKIASVFGAGTSIVPAPTSVITTPSADGGAMPGTVIATSFSKRGVEHLELILNGHKWAEAKGNVFGPNGQPEGAYGMQVPAGIPNGNYDIVVRSFDDLGTKTDSAVRTAVKGAPCADASTCLKGQKCEAGKCFWDAPTGNVGDDCTFNEFCLSGLCSGTKDQQICTMACVEGPNDSCPDGLKCAVANQATGQGVCFFPPDESGCCSANNGSSASVLAHAGLGGLLLGFVIRRRRRK